MPRLLLFVLSLAMLVGACATTPAAPPPAPLVSEYAPLKVGASWTYKMRFPGQNGERTITIIDKKNGYFLDSAGGQFQHTAQGLKDPARFILRAPLRPGVVWKAIVSASAVEQYETVSVGEPCQALAGTFSDCVIVKASLRQDAQHTLHIRFAWAKGIGLVKVTTELETAGKRIPQTEQSLLRYNLSGTGPAKAEAGDKAPEGWSR